MTSDAILIDSDSDDQAHHRSRRPRTRTPRPQPLSSSQSHIRDASSPDSSLPTFHELVHRAAQNRQRGSSVLAATFLDIGDASPARVLPSNRSGSLRRITSLPAKSPSHQQQQAKKPCDVRTNAQDIEVIELGSDSVGAPSDRGRESDPEPSSPILTQFTQATQQHALLATDAARQRNRVEAVERAHQDARRAGPSRVVDAIILGSSPDLPRPVARTSSKRRKEADRDGKTFRLVSSPPPSSPTAGFMLDDEPLSPINQPPLPRTGDVPPPLKPGSRTGSLQRKTSLLDALDALVPVQEEEEEADDQGVNGRGSSTASPSLARQKRAKAQSSSPEKQRKRTRPSVAIAGDARLFSSDTENDTIAASDTGVAARLEKAQATKQAKEAEREAKRLEREFKKAERERLAAEKKRYAEANKLRRGKGDTMKELIVRIDERLVTGSAREALLKPCFETIEERMKKDGAEVTTFQAEDGEMPNTIRFKRKVKARLDTVRRSWVPLPAEVIEDEKVILVLLDGKEVVQHVEASTLLPLVQRVRAAAGEGFQLFLLVHGMYRHFSRLKTKENQEYAKRIRSALAADEGARPAASRRTTSAPAATTMAPGAVSQQQESVETALMRLQVMERCFIVHAGALVELVEWIVRLTGDISLRPYKVVRSSFLSFCAEGTTNTFGPAPISAAGEGGGGGRNTTGANERETMRLMLMQIPRVTSHVSTAIMSTYPTLSSLYTAYHRCKTQDEVDSLLAPCQVETNVDGTLRAANRRGIGEALSRRIAAVLMGQDPLALVGGLI